MKIAPCGVPSSERAYSETPPRRDSTVITSPGFTPSRVRPSELSDPVASLNTLDLTRLGVKPGDVITVESRRGGVSLYARSDEGTPQGAIFIPFCYYEAAANVLTNPALDPVGKIPEFKYCAVKVTPGGQVGAHSSFGGGQLLSPVEA